MAEDVRATGADQETNGGEPEKTFTQEEVNAIVGKRLYEEKEKYADYDELKDKAAKYDEAEEASKSELQKATERAEDLQKEVDKMKRDKKLHEIRAKVAKETGVPENLLTGEDEESCTAQAKAVLKFAKPNAYPDVPDGGEVHNSPSGKTRDKFAAWFNESLK